MTDGEDPFRWIFLSDVCKHCEEAGCLEACPTGSIVRTEVGSVLVQNDVCNGCGYCVVSCPFGVIDRRPTPLPDAGGAFKCTFCYDRQKSGLVPACAKVCPTESIVFGRLDDLRARANEARASSCNNTVTTTRNFTIRRTLRSRGIHAFFLIPRRTGSLRASAETAGSDNLSEVCVDSCIRDGNRINHRDAAGVCIFILMDAPASEKRLEELREKAWQEGVVPGRGVDVIGGPIPRKPGYYGEPVVKPPVWTWEIPLYFFFGGIAGMSAVIALAAVLFHHVDVARAAMWLAAIAGAVLSPILLIMDLGRPHLFLNMLRVFKHRSAMSMGAWILTAFGACAVPGLIALELHAHQIFPAHLINSCASPPGFSFLVRRFLELCSRLIPACSSERRRFPPGFCIAHCCRFILEPPDWDLPPPCWNCWATESPHSTFIGFYAAAVETALLIWLSVDKHGVADRAIHEHGSGWLIRIGEVLNGPLALILRFFGLVPFAAISFLIGALVSRVGWIAVGKVSGSDPESVFAAERY